MTDPNPFAAMPDRRPEFKELKSLYPTICRVPGNPGVDEGHARVYVSRVQLRDDWRDLGDPNPAEPDLYRLELNTWNPDLSVTITGRLDVHHQPETAVFRFDVLGIMWGEISHDEDPRLLAFARLFDFNPDMED